MSRSDDIISVLSLDRSRLVLLDETCSIFKVQKNVDANCSLEQIDSQAVCVSEFLCVCIGGLACTCKVRLFNLSFIITE